MRKFKLLGLLILISAALLFSTSAFGASGNSFKFSDSYKEKWLCDSYGFCSIFPFGKFQINSNINFQNVDISQFNSDTCLDVEVGDLSLPTCLGDDPAYRAGITRANMVLTGDDYYLGDNIPYLWVSLKWSTKKLTIKIKALTGTPDIQIPIAAYDYIGDDPGPIQDSDVASISLDNGDTTFIDTTFDVYETGSIKIKTNRKYDIDLYQISVKANGTP